MRITTKSRAKPGDDSASRDANRLREAGQYTVSMYSNKLLTRSYALGCVEQFFNARGRMQFQSWVFSVARYEHPSGAPLTKPLLFAALEEVIRAHVELAAYLPPASESPYWVRIPSLDLNKVVTFLPEDSGAHSLAPTLEREFATPTVYAPDLPFWRLLVFADGHLAFALDHALGDGQSGPAFHASLLPALRGMRAPPVAHSGLVEGLPADAQMPPPIERALDTRMPLWYALRGIARAVFPALHPRLAAAWSGHPVPRANVPDTRVRIAHLSPAEAARLLKLARAHGTTLTGTLHTAVLVVLAGLIPDHERECTFSAKAEKTGADEKAAGARKRDKKPPTAVVTNIPISLRRYTGAPPTAVCNHVSLYQGVHALPKLPARAPADASPHTPAALGLSAADFPWATAAALTARLKREAPKSARLLGMVKLLRGRYEAEARGQLGKKRHLAFELSNLGAFPAVADRDGAQAGRAQEGHDPAAWGIREVLFVQADAALGAALKLNVVGTPDGGVGMAVTWGKGAIEDEFAEEFVTLLFAGIRNLIEEAT